MSLEPKVSRERILRGAEALLASGHYGDLTVDALARSLRMSKSTLYKYFPSKEDVVVALVRSACDQADIQLADALAVRGASGQLRALAATIGRYGERLPRAIVVDAENIPPACVARLRHMREAFAKGARTVFERGAAAGEFDRTDPPLAASAFVAAAHAVLVDGVNREAPAVDQRVDRLTQLFLPGVSA